ncbi:alpha/beta-hydrolase [Stereum hirsutum FP-91666 SS1]|uniref:alpha/beta-hydrolase n=1 Tax=Stereum hirsutum (strain FP-91666) TaxID=721885 RepID=UPI000444A649|nr:alpha/beta-hydrolase [Stereum hirsutum FP-91666 SS1]EIM84650.1 alpha/beta-hydrolase [Stereum hirsutum FP-91666 SS1]
MTRMGPLRILVIFVSFFLTNALSRSTNATTLEPSKRDFVSSRRNRLPSLARRDDETEGFNSSFSVVKNSGVCETTPGVGQISGYVDVGVNMSMWFWFFEARENPETVPFTLWLNGGPGCSSMIGLFQENGPCHILEDGQTTELNPFSWNNISNMIYIDQPIGTGFSFGTDTVNSTEAAAPFVWEAFQLLFESGEFSKFQSRDFIFATESYGGHYGPAFVTFFDEQNALIDAGEIEGEKIVVSALMINNGWYDPLIQNEAYVLFAMDPPGYTPWLNDTQLSALNTSFFEPGGCEEQEIACEALRNTDSANRTVDEVCIKADNFCVENVFVPAFGDRDVDDLRQNSSALFPPEFYLDFLANETIKALIGATSTYGECPDAPDELFERTGDDARSWLKELGDLANSGLKLLIWAGDADINCNWIGGHNSVLAMDWFGNETLHATPLTNITISGVNGGEPVAAVQNVENFSFARVYQSGHEVPAFQPATALEVFRQIINMEQLHSV